jgi:hypothetical protein
MKSGKDNERSIHQYIYLYMMGGEKEFHVIHIHIQWPIWYRQELFFFTFSLGTQ